MKARIFTLTILITLISILTGCTSGENMRGGTQGMKFGKTLYITIEENEVVDTAYLQKVLDGEIKKDTPYFDLWDKDELKKLIKYMDKNSYIIVPGKYSINQAWEFEDGIFILNNGEKREVLKFQKK